ncbi:MAG: hypothetical protein CL522_04860 [Actinobacteria bacterium]|nr:hypothetical protein [Actinomycetota bacterium]
MRRSSKKSRSSSVDVNPKGPISLGFDIGGTNIRGVALRPDLSFGGVISHPCEDDHEKIIESLIDIANQIQESEKHEIGCVGIGVAGFVDRFGIVRTSPNLSTFKNFPLLEKVRCELDAPVLIENDATSATWAEVQLGVARESENVIMVCLGTGIGAGLYFNSELLRGASGFAGEVGHMTIVPDGLPCPCGRLGCWERYAAGSSLGDIAEDLRAAGKIGPFGGDEFEGERPFSSERVARLVLKNDKEAIKVLEHFSGWLAMGLVNLVNILDPQSIVLGGGITQLGEHLLDPVRKSFEELTPERSLRSQDLIVLAEFGNKAGAIGAALLAKQNLLA